MQGSIMVIGGVTGMGGTMVPRQLVGVAVRMQGVYVGSRSMHEDLARFVEVAQLRPVIDRVFPFAAAPDAFRHLAEGRHFGKVALDLA
jgi:NADPH:quinone reductase-like Zn-dependent oxidoreductase